MPRVVAFLGPLCAKNVPIPWWERRRAGSLYAGAAVVWSTTTQDLTTGVANFSRNSRKARTGCILA